MMSMLIFAHALMKEWSLNRSSFFTSVFFYSSLCCWFMWFVCLNEDIRFLFHSSRSGFLIACTYHIRFCLNYIQIMENWKFSPTFVQLPKRYD